jgi:predicted PhzF superfamily epimerase YddE/YHI9
LIFLPAPEELPASKWSEEVTIPLFHVDAFTDRPFAGNPAAVCLLPTWTDDSWLQAVAREMNLSETAFLVRNADGFDLRWFTPAVEVDLCGHATLASAHILWQQDETSSDIIRFSTRSGTLQAIRRGKDVELDFPLKPEVPAEAPPGLLDALGTSARYVGKNKFDYLIEVESDTALRKLAPDFQRLATVPVRGIIVTSRSDDPRFDFLSRFFAPAVGVNEDPVTGSAHCCLGDFWRKRLGKTEFLAFQASTRGGVVKVRVTKDRVFLGGQAVAVSSGELLVETSVLSERSVR